MTNSVSKNKGYRVISGILATGVLVTLFCRPLLFAQDKADFEINLDLNSSSVALPKLFKPYIDLSGRGFHRLVSYPQGLAAGEVLENWQKEIGFSGIYRLQYNLWEINEHAKDASAQEKLLAAYEDIIKKISDAGGIVILDIYGVPAGMGKVLDRKSPPLDLKAFKELVKGYIRELSCNKKYNIWYELWSAPDLDNFFLGRKQEYLNMYRAVSEGIKELELETKINIPLGGPAVSWWFQNCDNNSIVTPEKSLIYELIKYCSDYHLPLDFISWHAYSTDPRAELELTRYAKPPVALIREWLSYFNFERDTPLLVDEWNYDSAGNLLAARSEKAHICASFIPSRLKNMHEAGLDYQLYFSLEDFQNNKEGLIRNVGAFGFDAGSSEYKGAPKSVYNVFRMLAALGKNMFVLPKSNNEFIGAIATAEDDYIGILFYNYIDPQIGRNYLSRNVAALNDAERKMLLALIRQEKLDKIIQRQADVSKLRASSRLKGLLKKAQELNEQADIFKAADRKINLSIKNLKENYSYQRFSVDASCGSNCKFSPVEEKDIQPSDLYQEVVTLPAYSVNLVVLKKKPKQAEAVPREVPNQAQ